LKKLDKNMRKKPFFLEKSALQKIFCFLLDWEDKKFKFIASFFTGEVINLNLLLPFSLGRQKI